MNDKNKTIFTMMNLNGTAIQGECMSAAELLTSEREGRRTLQDLARLICAGFYAHTGLGAEASCKNSGKEPGPTFIIVKNNTKKHAISSESEMTQVSPE